MAIIQELGLFSWKDVQDDPQTIGNLERFKLVIETMPDQKLIQILRRDYIAPEIEVNGAPFRGVYLKFMSTCKKYTILIALD